ncbi:MAG: YceH family protein [Solirubrobacteraceae bacterium]
MHFGQLTDVEQRVLGCLIEKRWTTPDQYPLSLNALRLACNQSTNRDPVTHYDESQVRDAAQRLSRYGLARLASGAGSRATKYRHLAEEGLGLDREQLAVLCVLVLRGPQTPGELKGRSERLAHVGSLADVERVLGELAAKGYVERIGRRPGQKEDRFRQLLGAEAGDEARGEATADGARRVPIAAGGFDEPVASRRYEEPPRTYEEPARDQEPARGDAEPACAVAAPPAGHDALEARVTALEAEVADLRSRLADLLD